jgi:hypothetical protein
MDQLLKELQNKVKEAFQKDMDESIKLGLLFAYPNQTITPSDLMLDIKEVKRRNCLWRHYFINGVLVFKHRF